MGAQKVVIDTDPAMGYALRDVDDGLALAYLLALPDEFDVLGITTVFGNVSLPRATARAREAVRVTGRTGVEVFPGAWSRHALGDVSSASMFLPDAVAANPGEVTVLALGPLTNVATAGLADRAFYRDVKRIVVMGGAVDEGVGIPLVSPLEFNFFSDATAADLVLDAPCEKVVITGDICRQALFTRRELDSLWAMRSRVATYLAYRVRPWLKLNQVLPFLPRKGGFVPWDIVAAVYLRRPDLFSGVEGNGVRLSTPFHKYACIRTSMHPHLLRWAPSRYSLSTARSRALHERRLGALDTTPYLWNGALGRGLLRTGALEPDASRDGWPARLPTRLEPRPLLADFLSAISRY